MSGFLDEKYGFLPIVLPITEPAVGYGAIGALAFFSQPLGAAKDGLGRPSITAVGGMATENGTWGALAADSRYWFDDRLQTVAAVVDASINLDFHGIGEASPLDQHPLGYEIHRSADGADEVPAGRLALLAGLGYTFAGTRHVRRPDRHRACPTSSADASAAHPSTTWDTRDNIFTPTRGSYVELGAGITASTSASTTNSSGCS